MLTRMKGFCKPSKSAAKKEKKSERGTKENFKRFDETSSKREFPSAPSLLLVQIFMDTPKKLLPAQLTSSAKSSV